MHWFYNSPSSLKSLQKLDSLVKQVILDKDFNQEHLLNFSASHESQHLDKIKDCTLVESLFAASDGWHQMSVKLPLSFEWMKYTSESMAVMFKVDTLYLGQ